MRRFYAAVTYARIKRITVPPSFWWTGAALLALAVLIGILISWSSSDGGALVFVLMSGAGVAALLFVAMPEIKAAQITRRGWSAVIVLVLSVLAVILRILAG